MAQITKVAATAEDSQLLKTVAKVGRRSLSLEQKYQIAEALRAGMKQREASRMFGVSLGTVNRIFKTQQSVLAQYEQSIFSVRRPQIRRKTPKYEAINDAVYRWYREQTEGPGPSVPTGTEIQRKAREVAAEQSDAKDFCASNGWLYSWRKMYNVSPQATGSQAPTPLSMSDLRRLDASFEADQTESAPMDTQQDPTEPPEATDAKDPKLTNGDATAGEPTTEEILDALDLLEQVCTKRFKGNISGHFTEFRTTLQAAMIREKLLGDQASYDDMKPSTSESDIKTEPSEQH